MTAAGMAISALFVSVAVIIFHVMEQRKSKRSKDLTPLEQINFEKLAKKVEKHAKRKEAPVTIRDLKHIMIDMGYIIDSRRSMEIADILNQVGVKVCCIDIELARILSRLQ